MNVLKIVGIILFVLVLLVLIGGFIFLKTFDIKKFKPQITAAADKALGRHVDFNDIELKVSIKEGIKFHLTDLRVSENSEFAQKDFASIKEVSVGLDLMTFLNARQVSVPQILINAPEITIIRNAKGELNVQTIGAAQTANPNGTGKSSENSAAALPAVFINSLSIQGARLNYIDQSVTPPFETSVSQLDLKIEHFSLSKPFDFAMQAAILSPNRNFKVDGHADLNLLAKEVRLSGVHIETDLGQFPLSEIQRLPYVKGIPIPEVLQGQFDLTLKECVLSEKGLGALVLDSRLVDGKIYIKEAAPGIPVDLSKIQLDVKDFAFGRPFYFSFQTALMGDNQNVDVKGNVTYDMSSQGVQLNNVTFNTELSHWPLAKLKAELLPLKDAKLPDVLSGALQVLIKDLAVGPKGLGDFHLDVNLKDGSVSLKDAAPETSFAASKINLSLENLTLKDPFKFSLQMAYLNELPDIDLRGIAAVDLPTQSVRLKDFNIGVDLGLLNLEQLKSTMGSLKSVPFPESLGGKINITVKDLEASAQGVKNILMDFTFQDGHVSMNQVAPGISFKAGDINLGIENFTFDKPFLSKLSLAYLSDKPNIDFTGAIAFNMQTHGIVLKDGLLNLDLSQMNLTELKTSVEALSQVPLPESIGGEMKVAIKNISAGPKGLGSVLVDMHLNNGSFKMKDLSPGVSLAASQIGLDIKNINLDKNPMDIKVDAAYLSEQPNLSFSGSAVVDAPQSMVQLKGSSFKTDLSLLSMEQLRGSIAALKDVPLPQILKGLLNVQIDELTAGPKGLVSFQSKGDLSSGMVKLKELNVPIDISQIKFQADGTNAKLDDVEISIGKGKIKAKAAIDNYLVKPIINKEVTIEGLDLTEILEQKDAPMKMQGVIYAAIKAQGDISNLKSLVGDGTFEIKDAKISSLNVLKAVFDAIKIPLLPNLSEIVLGVLPEEYRKEFEKPDTDFKSVKWAMTIAEGLIHMEPIDVQSDNFSFIGKGDAGFDQAYVIDGGFKLSKNLSELLVKDVEQPFAYMVDENNLVTLPIHVKGKGSQPPKFQVDAVLKDLTTNALKSKGKEELGKVLGKFLNKGEAQPEGAPQTEGQASDPAAQKSEKSSGEQIIDGLFGTIFK